MSTERQKAAARRNLEKARAARTARGREQKASSAQGLTAADRNGLRSTQFAFPEKRKEPLTDASHVRNAIARFDQVEDVTDAERDEAWARIKRAAQRFHVDVDSDNWRELFTGSDKKKRSEAR